jgi:MarR-like DNA-binding transcriptional regulator SgrR of sgrS sRNA
MQKQHLDSVATFQKLLDVKELTTYERLLYVALTVSANGKTECEPTVNTLARLCGCSYRQIMRALTLLEAKGYVTRTAQFTGAENNAQTANKYILRFAG